MQCNNFEIVDVFHAYAKTHESDYFARAHIHGLNVDYLQENGFSNEETLIQMFKKWLKKKDYVDIVANNPQCEIDRLKIRICDIALPPWAERHETASHQVALCFKELSIPICYNFCPQKAHSSFVKHYSHKDKLTNEAKRKHGFHCSLYDAYELYLFYVMSK